MPHKTKTGAGTPIFYGWIVIGVAFVTLAVAVNARTAFSLLFPPMLDDFGWDRGTTAGAFSVGFIASTAFTPLIGVLMDRYGPRLVIPLGAAIVAAGFVATTWVSTPVGFYLTLGLMVIGGTITMSFIGHSMFLPSWFTRRRGLAVGIAFSGAGVGAIIFLPVVQIFIERFGWRSTCLAIALVIAIILIPLNMIFQRRRPADLGLHPDGAPANTDGSPPDQHADLIVDRKWVETDWTLKLAARTARFWWIFAGYFCGLFAWYAIQVHQTKYLIELGYGAKEAAFALGLVALVGVPGQIAIGALSDRVGREIAWTVALSGFVICYGLLIVLASVPSPVIVYIMVVAQGTLGYGLASLYGVIPSDIFAGPRFATIFSVCSLGGNIGAGAGPWLTGALFDVSGSYVPAFWLSLTLSIISIICIWMASPGKVRTVPGRVTNTTL